MYGSENLACSRETEHWRKVRRIHDLLEIIFDGQSERRSNDFHRVPMHTEPAKRPVLTFRQHVAVTERYCRFECDVIGV